MAGLRKGSGPSRAKVKHLTDIELARAIEAKRLDGSGNPHQFYTFEPYMLKGTNKQSFQHKILRCDAKMIALIAANRVGKSFLGARFVVARCLGFDPFYDGIRHPLQRLYETPQRWWACTDAARIDDLFEIISEMIPPAELRRSIKSKGAMAFFFHNGSYIKLKSYDQDRRAYQGAKLHGILNDEEPPEHIYLEQKTRLIDLGGIMVFTLTPVEGTTWLHEKLHGLASTPYGRKCFERTSGKFSWFTAKMRDNPHLSADDVEAYIEEFGTDEDALAIRIEGNYKVLAGENAFGSSNIERIWKETREPLMHGIFDQQGRFVETPKGDAAWNIWRTAIKGMGYAIGVDPAQGGEKSDNSAACVMEVGTGEVVATLAGKLEPIDFSRMIMHAGLHFNHALLTIEMNNHGGTVQTLIRQGGYPDFRLYRRTGFSGRIASKLDSLGWQTNPTSKPMLVQELRSALEDKALVIPCEATVAEMGTFVRFKKHTPGYHGYGASSRMKKDDRVIAIGLAYQGCKQMTMYVDGGEAHRARDAALAVRERIMEEKNRYQEEDEFMDIDEFLGIEL